MEKTRNLQAEHCKGEVGHRLEQTVTRMVVLIQRSVLDQFAQDLTAKIYVAADDITPYHGI